MTTARVAAFDSLSERLIDKPAPPPVGGVTSVNGDTGPAVELFLDTIYTYGQGHTPDVHNVFPTVNGNIRFPVATHENGWLTGVGFFETPDVDDDARLGVWLARRYYSAILARNTGTFAQNEMYSPTYPGPGIPDNVVWRDIGTFTGSSGETGGLDTGDLMWNRQYVSNNFFFNLPLSIPDLGSGGAAQVVLQDWLYRKGPQSNGVANVRTLNGWGQQLNFVFLQAHGIEPAFSAVFDNGGAVGDGTGFMVNASNPGNVASSNIKGGFTVAMDDGGGLTFHAGIWAWDQTISPDPHLREVATFTQAYGMSLNFGGLEIPTVDETTFPVSAAGKNRIVFGSVAGKFMASINGAGYVPLSTVS